MSTLRQRLALSLGAFFVAGSASVVAAGAASASPVDCPAVPGAAQTLSSSTSECAANADASSAAAAFGNGGSATANATNMGLSLAIGADGGIAVSEAMNFSGPAAIAIGQGARVETWGVSPGLSIGIAGPGATVTVSGTSAPTCSGGLAFAGDFQTLKGCVSDGNTVIPLG